MGGGADAANHAQGLSWPLAPISSASIVPGSWSGQKSHLQSSFQHVCTAEFGRWAQPHVSASHGAQAWVNFQHSKASYYMDVRHHETSAACCIDISVAMAAPGCKAAGGGPGRSWQTCFAQNAERTEATAQLHVQCPACSGGAGTQSHGNRTALRPWKRLSASRRLFERRGLGALCAGLCTGSELWSRLGNRETAYGSFMAVAEVGILGVLCSEARLDSASGGTSARRPLCGSCCGPGCHSMAAWLGLRWLGLAASSSTPVLLYSKTQ